MNDEPIKTVCVSGRKRWKIKALKILSCALIGVCAVLFLALRFMLWTPGESYHGPLPPADEELRTLAAELHRDVSFLSEEIGERNVSRRPAQLAQAADWIDSELSKLGYTVNRQKYEVSGVACSNIEAELVGAVSPHDIILIGAHYDSACDTPGANDNGSGVAATLALARRFARQTPDRTVRFVAFVNEEPPYFHTEQMGSWVYAKRCRERNENITAMLSLETIGYYSDAPNSQNYPFPLNRFYPSTGNFVAFIGDTSSVALVRRTIEAFRRHEQFPSEGGTAPAVVRGIGFSDHWSFAQEGYPALMVTDTALFRYSFYHETEDTPDKIDFEKMARVVRGLERTVKDFATASPSPAVPSMQR